MNHRVQFTSQSQGRPAGLIGLLLLVPLLILGALLGFVVLAIALGLLLLAGVVFFARLWWLRRKILRAGNAAGYEAEDAVKNKPESGTTILEGEYRIIREDKREE